ncbi:PhnD/SsuA/transferrin family substrate-binding protein [uncultured Croceitalea sp.]|uniref:phosphate/phosphite/phosphonate ABC transporter substrate-binding protein n=1 Tax=uncultured Croceitalea sp. TaxID=1798908 RepID=UPI0033065EF2
MNRLSTKIDASKLLAFGLVLLSFLNMACESKIRPLRLATYTYATNNRIRNLEPLSRELEKVLERPVHIESYPDAISFIDGIRSDEVDIALINTLGYLILSLDNEVMEPIAALKIKNDAVDNYKTVLLTNIDSITELNRLKHSSEELSMMFVAEGSTSGNLVPRLLLSSIGIKSPENQFKEVKYGGNHTSSFEKLLKGKADICAIGSNEYFKQIKKDSTLLDTHNLLWVSEEIPLGPVLLNHSFADEERKKIIDMFLTLHLKNSSALESIKSGWSEAKQTERFYPISDSYYNDFREINGNRTDLIEILDLF